MQMALNLDTGEHRAAGEQPADDDEGQPVEHAPCVFAAAGGLAPPVQPSEKVERVAEIAFATVAFPASVTVGQGLAAPPPWATGPPIDA